MHRGASAWVFAALAWALRDPRSALLVQDRENELLAALGQARIQSPGSSWSKTFDELWMAIDGLDDDARGRRFEELAVEHARLFYGPPFPSVLPYEHAYRKDGDAGAVCSQLEAVYRRMGFEVSEDFRDLPDHICVLLEFASVLLQRDLESEITEFRSSRLQEFMVTFAERMRAVTRDPLFEVIAGVMLDLAAEADWYHGASQPSSSQTGVALKRASSRTPSASEDSANQGSALSGTTERGALERQEARE